MITNLNSWSLESLRRSSATAGASSNKSVENLSGSFICNRSSSDLFTVPKCNRPFPQAFGPSSRFLTSFRGANVPFSSDSCSLVFIGGFSLSQPADLTNFTFPNPLISRVCTEPNYFSIGRFLSTDNPQTAKHGLPIIQLFPFPAEISDSASPKSPAISHISPNFASQISGNLIK
jgi:hypothetical protein